MEEEEDEEEKEKGPWIKSALLPTALIVARPYLILKLGGTLNQRVMDRWTGRPTKASIGQPHRLW